MNHLYVKKKEEFSGKPLLPQYFNWHNLRHKACSEWAHQGMVLVEIMARLGHSNIETTQKYLYSLGFSTVKYTKGDQPEYLEHPNKDELEEVEKTESEGDSKLYAYLSEKIGSELASEIVYHGGGNGTKKKLKKLGITFQAFIYLILFEIIITLNQLVECSSHSRPTRR